MLAHENACFLHRGTQTDPLFSALSESVLFAA